MTNTKPLICFKPASSAAKRIKHEASNMFTYRGKSTNPVRGSLKNISYPLKIDYFLWWLTTLSKLQTNRMTAFQINFDVYLKSSSVEAVLSSAY